MSVDVLPCGCVIETVVENGFNVFKIAPCKMTCKYYLYAVEETKRQGKPVDYRKAP